MQAPPKCAALSRPALMLVPCKLYRKGSIFLWLTVDGGVARDLLHACEPLQPVGSLEEDVAWLA